MRGLRLLLLVAIAAVQGLASAAAAQTPAQADILKRSGALERLFEKTGVHHRAAGARTPDFVADPAWPRTLPNNWVLGQVAGAFVDSRDHLWIYQRARTLTTEEAGLMGAAGQDAQGRPISALGHPRPFGPTSDCCQAAPAVMEFDQDGKLVQAWGGPADPGFIGGKCRVEAGCLWPNSEHGITVDADGNVWLGGNGRTASSIPWTTNPDGGDGVVLKFTRDGRFIMAVGGPAKAPGSNDKTGGFGGTPLLFQPADITIEPGGKRAFISDGYGNRRVLIVDAQTGKYLGHFGAYGNSPVDDQAVTDGGPFVRDYEAGRLKPPFFRNPVHCVRVADDGLIYVCDRGNNRVQVFNGRDPKLGQPCENREGVAGRCGFVKEQAVSIKTRTTIPGTAVAINFSSDPAQSCLYVADNSNMTIYILNRQTLGELGRIGRTGRGAGEFYYLHNAAIDSAGNLYTAEVDSARRVQRFVRYGATGCSGAGNPVVGGILP